MICILFPELCIASRETITFHFLLLHLLSANGEVIVTLLPINEKLPWILPAKFRPELVPEELMAPILTVSVQRIFHFGTKLGDYHGALPANIYVLIQGLNYVIILL